MTAGGANTKQESYGANPQFKLFLPEVDTDEYLASCVISVMQQGVVEGGIAIGKLTMASCVISIMQQGVIEGGIASLLCSRGLQREAWQ